MELMVAMAITAIIVTVLVSVTSIALDTWNRSRAQLRASRQAKSFIDTIAKDFESLVVRRGNTSEWLSVIAGTGNTGGSIKSSNASTLIFFSAVTDRYNGDVGVAGKDLGGDVSCVAYKLDWRNPINPADAGDNRTFVINRWLVNPKDTFEKLLGATDANDATKAKSLSKVFEGSGFAQGFTDPTKVDPANFICENVFQFSVTFNVQASHVVDPTTTTLVNVPVTIGKNNNAKTFTISGQGLVISDNNDNPLATATATAAELKSGRITSVDIAVTVISDFGIDGLARRTFTGNQQAEFLAKNTYDYTKTVQIPSM